MRNVKAQKRGSGKGRARVRVRVRVRKVKVCTCAKRGSPLLRLNSRLFCTLEGDKSVPSGNNKKPHPPPPSLLLYALAAFVPFLRPCMKEGEGIPVKLYL